MAQEGPLPRLYDVTGVAADDVLNVRERPDSASPLVGRLTPDARGIEVTATDDTGRWAQINTDERTGWVALRYLAPHPETEGPPTNLACYGTEPFWALALRDGAALYTSPDSPERRYAVDVALGTGIRGDARAALIARDDGGRLTAAVSGGFCTDGMSDRSYALNATVVVEDDGSEPRMLTGCCSLATGE